MDTRTPHEILSEIRKLAAKEGPEVFSQIEKQVEALWKVGNPGDRYMEERSLGALTLAFLAKPPSKTRELAMLSLVERPRAEAMCLMGDLAPTAGAKAWYQAACAVTLEKTQVAYLGSFRRSRLARTLITLGEMPSITAWRVETPMTSQVLKIVSPVAAKDIERARIMLTSIRKFFVGDVQIRIVADARERSQIQKALSGIDPRVSFFNHDDVLLGLQALDMHGWFKQQLIKLQASAGASAFTLVLDADTFFVRPTTVDDLVLDGRAVCMYHTGSQKDYAKWYALSTMVLGKQPSNVPRTLNMTGGAILSNKIVRGLLTYLEKLYGDWLPALHEMTPETRTLQEGDGQRRKSVQTFDSWTEFTLYHLFGTHAGLWDEQHFEGPLFGPNIRDMESWDVSKTFENPEYRLQTVQSMLGVPASEVWERVKGYLT